MKKSLCILFLFIIFGHSNYAQIYSTGSYRSAENSTYWKNRKPFEGYWQQDVRYKIKANIDEKTDIVDGKEELVYYNNSPDELPFVYFHLYQNAFQPGSYSDELFKVNGAVRKYGKYEQQKLGTDISKITINGTEVKTELDNTILKVFLPQPLKSGDSLLFNIDFKTYFDPGGNIRRRMKLYKSYGYKHYNGVHWYPRISVYDRKQGWDTDQHLGKEFYGDYGTYEVELSFAPNFIVEGTGVLLNENEMLPDTLRKKLDIKNFKDKKLESKPSEIIPAEGARKTWKYYAVNVHDFAFTADPAYRIGEANWNGVRCIALVQEPHAARWQNAAEYASKVIQIYSEDFGMYIYPKMIVADAADGMEYPMLTLDGGLDPDYRSLLAHEIGHNWFFGMVGNNETYRACLDEGFTQFLTSWSCSKIDGAEIVKTEAKSKYIKNFQKPDLVINKSVYNGYIFEAAKGDETTLNTHSDYFNSALAHGGGYRQVYSKTATMLYNLQYVLGDELFLKAMQHYFNQWKLCHPYVEDFRNSIIHFTKTDLNWFFDEWMETSKTIDYKIGKIKKGHNKDEYAVTFKRKGRMQMPIDFQVMAKDSNKYNFYIPNNWSGKKTDATTLPRWIGWDKLKSSYTATITIPGGISNVMIDPTNRLADVNMLNNNSKFPLNYSFDSKVNNPSDWTHYELLSRPDMWYNGYDGIKVGLHLNGNYLNYFHVFDATVWINSGFGQNYLDTVASINKYDDVSIRLNYKTATDKFIKKSFFLFSLNVIDGLNSYSAGFEKKDNSQKNKLYIKFKCMYRNSTNDLNYLLYPNEWQIKKLNNTLTLGLEHNYVYKKGTGNINLALKSSALTNDYSYSAITLTAINKNNLGKIKFNTRTFVQYGMGYSWADESFLYAAGANSEELMDNKFTRSQGFFNPKSAGFGASTNNFHAGGGLNLRGYAGYLMAETDNYNTIFYAYKGTTGAAFNAELEFDELIGLKPMFKKTIKFNTYLFGDAGVLDYDHSSGLLKITNLRADAGLGAALTILRWGPLQKCEPLTIRFDMPFFLNSIPATDKDYFAFRWVIGVNRVF